MKKVNILISLFFLAMLTSSCHKDRMLGLNDASWHKYAINEYCIPSEVIISSLNSKTNDTKLSWHCTFKSPDGLRIKENRNKEKFETIAREHGETGEGFYSYPRYVSCLYQVDKIEIIGFKGNTESVLSSQFSYCFLSIEGFIKSGYKDGSNGIKEENLGEIGKMDFLDMEHGLTISYPKSKIEGEFDRIEVRVTLKDGKTLRTEIPL